MDLHGRSSRTQEEILQMRPSRLALSALLAGLCLMLGLSMTVPQSPLTTPAPAAEPPARSAVADEWPPMPPRVQDPALTVRQQRQPNVVVVVLDDFDMTLVPTMRSFRRMARRGVEYRRSFVVDGLCCVSRASYQTGQFPHQTRVFTNSAGSRKPAKATGGWLAFAHAGNMQRSVNVQLQAAGYHTGFIGKYINGYNRRTLQAGVVPPGWDDLQILFPDAYNGWDFHATYVQGDRLRVAHHRAPPASASNARKDAAYVGTMIDRAALRFIRDNAGSTRPYYLQVAPFVPHSRMMGAHYKHDPVFPAAFRDRGRNDCGAVRCGRLHALQRARLGDVRPRSRSGRPLRSWRFDGTVGRPDRMLHQRARSAQSADRMIGRILDAVGPDTYVLVTSDNGFHMREHSTASGKGMPYDSDIRVPLFVVGPGVAHGRTRTEVVSNIDLAPTLEQIAGITPEPYRSGRSLLSTFRGPHQPSRHYAFVEHTWYRAGKADPDKRDKSTLVPSYVAVRSDRFLLARIDLANGDGRRYGYELYDYHRTARERRNVFADRRYRTHRRDLMAKLAAFDRCRSVTRGEPVPARCRTLAGR